MKQWERGLRCLHKAVMLGWVKAKASTNAFQAMPSEVTIGNKVVKVGKKLGEGSYALVYEVRDSFGTRYALKQLIARTKEQQTQAENEIRYLSSCSKRQCQNVIGFFGSSTQRLPNDATEYNFLLEFAPDSLWGQMQAVKNADTPIYQPEPPAKAGPWSEKHVFEIFFQICTGLNALHSLSPKVSHRDLKIENVLVSAKGQYVLCDFGSCTERDQIYQTPSEILKEQENIHAFSTPNMRAPEMVDLYQRRRLNHKSDIWALGCILYMLAFFRHPFMEGNLQILQGLASLCSFLFVFSHTQIHSKYVLPDRHGFSNYFLKCLAALLQTDPERRPGLDRLLPVLQQWRTFLHGSGADLTLPAGATPPSTPLKASIAASSSASSSASSCASSSASSSASASKKPQSPLTEEDRMLSKLSLQPGELGMDQTVAQKLWHSFDQDRSGYLEKEEAWKLLKRYCRLQGLPAEAVKPKIRSLFLAFDKNKDGKISVSEFLGYENAEAKLDVGKMLKIGKGELIDRVHAQRLWRKYDKDRNGVLDRKEAEALFMDYCRTKMFTEAQAKATVQELFTLFDVDGDGEITFAELMGWQEEGWTCDTCRFMNASVDLFCFMCRAKPPPPPAPTAAADSADTSWAVFDDLDFSATPAVKPAGAAATDSSQNEEWDPFVSA
eukprot:g9177.t1